MTKRKVAFAVLEMVCFGAMTIGIMLALAWSLNCVVPAYQ